jgi:NAD(P)-dependent dehydrogenase (short-subunit alcohol dehydrogenase family)
VGPVRDHREHRVPVGIVARGRGLGAGEPERYAAVIAQTPLGRLGDPYADIGWAVAALVADDLGFLTGATIMLGGGTMILR